MTHAQVPTRSLRDEFKSVFGEALDTLSQLAAAEAKLEGLEGSADASSAMAAMEAALEEMARLQEEARRQDAYSIDANVSVFSFSCCCVVGFRRVDERRWKKRTHFLFRHGYNLFFRSFHCCLCSSDFIASARPDTNSSLPLSLFIQPAPPSPQPCSPRCSAFILLLGRRWTGCWARWASCPKKQTSLYRASAAAGRCASASGKFCSPTPTSCCSTSPPTIWT